MPPDIATRPRRWFEPALLILLWLALAALSVAWLDDWSRHGPAFAAGYGQAQGQALALAAAAGGLLWLWRERLFLALVRGLAGIAAWPAHCRRWWLAGAVGLGLVAVAALHWALKLQRIPHLPAAWLGPLKAVSVALKEAKVPMVTESTTVELLRVPGCLLLAWALYRWRHAALPLRAHLLLAGAVLAAVLAGLKLTDDKGPMLVLALALSVLSAGLTLDAARRAGFAAWLYGLLAGGQLALLLGAILALLTHAAPADRLAAWRQPFNGPLEYLAEASWLMQACGTQGCGLGHTPWCGHLGALMGPTLGKCPGMSKETQSDHVLPALAALWGAPAAWAIVAAVAVMLLLGLRLAARAAQPRHGVDAGGLAASAAGLYLLIMLAQLAVTALGSLGVWPTTGVNLPMLAWGRGNLLVLTLALVLVLPRPGSAPALPGTALASAWRCTATVATLCTLLLLALVASGLKQRLSGPAPERLAGGRANPWLPLPGCLRAADGTPAITQAGPAALAANKPAGTAADKQAAERAAERAALCDIAAVGAATAPVAALPADAALARALAQAAHTQLVNRWRQRDGLRVPQRADVVTTLDAGRQATAQALADCLTTSALSASACAGRVPAAAWARYTQRHEGAAARMVSIVQLRVADGALLAAAHARSPCSAAQQANTTRPAGCPGEAARPLARPGRLSHQGLHAHDMLASTVKPLLADGLLRAPDGERWHQGAPRAQLQDALVTSDTPFFIDQLLCFAPGLDPATCQRSAALARRQQVLGLSAPIALLGGAGLSVPGLMLPLPAWPPTGRSAPAELAAARRCQGRPHDDRWRGCDGEQLAAVVAPMWGQGEARGSPLAVARLYQHLAAAERSLRRVPQPRLWAAAGAGPALAEVGIAPATARLVLEALRQVPISGTAVSACRALLGLRGCQGRGFAIKTGTSMFPDEHLPVAQRAERCRRAHADESALRQRGQAIPRALRQTVLACAYYPMKWAVLLHPADPGQGFDSVTVVLAERNSHGTSGRLDAAGDRGPNVAVEVALLLADQTATQPRGQSVGRAP